MNRNDLEDAFNIPEEGETSGFILFDDQDESDGFLSYSQEHDVNKQHQRLSEQEADDQRNLLASPSASQSQSTYENTMSTYDFEPQDEDAAPVNYQAHRHRNSRTGSSYRQNPHHSSSNNNNLINWFLERIYSLGTTGYKRVGAGNGTEHGLHPGDERRDISGSGHETIFDETYEMGDVEPGPSSSTLQSRRIIYGGGQNNDGVFSNLVARPGQRHHGQHGSTQGSLRRLTHIVPQMRAKASVLFDPGKLLNRVTFGAMGDSEPYIMPEEPLEFVGGDDEEDKDNAPPPSYEAAANDAAPAYWDSTVYVSPVRGTFDEIVVDGLPVGSFFGFAWSMLISILFQFVGFLLTYLLHTTHAAKNGARVGLGITLIRMGLFVKNPLKMSALDITFAPLDEVDPNGPHEIQPGNIFSDDTVSPDSSSVATAEPSFTFSSLFGGDSDSKNGEPPLEPASSPESFLESLFGSITGSDNSAPKSNRKLKRSIKSSIVSQHNEQSNMALQATIPLGTSIRSSISSAATLSVGAASSLAIGHLSSRDSNDPIPLSNPMMDMNMNASLNSSNDPFNMDDPDFQMQFAYNNVLGIILLIFGWILVIGSLISYYRVLCLARSIQRNARNNGPLEDPPADIVADVSADDSDDDPTTQNALRMLSVDPSSRLGAFLMRHA